MKNPKRVLMLLTVVFLGLGTAEASGSGLWHNAVLAKTSAVNWTAYQLNITHTAYKTEHENIPHYDNNQVVHAFNFRDIPGRDGSKTITYAVTYRGDKEIGRQKVSEHTDQEPTNGTQYVYEPIPPSAPSYSAGTGFYNSYGDWIPSPTYNPGLNPGYTPQTPCADGTLSYSTGRGTCSHHGGEL